MNSPRPMRAAGWISTPVTAVVTFASSRGSTGTPASCSACETRWDSSACTPPIGEQDLHPADAARGRVALLGGGEVLAHLARHAGECGQAEHQGAKNGVLM